MLEYSFLGLMLILAASFLRKTKDKYEDVCVSVAAPIFLLLLKPIGLLSGFLRPHTMDEALRIVDLKLGLDGFAFAAWCVGWPNAILEVVYLALPLALAVSWVTSRSHTFLRACVIDAVLAFPLYMLVPAVGPAFSYSSWPMAGGNWFEPAMAYPRNCFPSMHFTWAMLLALNAKGFWRWLFSLYAGLMALATVASGQHYFIDVIVAVPFTFAVQALAVRDWSFANVQKKGEAHAL